MLDDFILESSIDLKICDELVEELDNNPLSQPGVMSGGVVDKDSKDSIDLTHPYFRDKTLAQRYIDELSKVLSVYKQKYKYSDIRQHYYYVEAVNIQKYPIGGGFKKWHYEESGVFLDLHRHLVYMTYLNDVEDGGTDFLYQNKTIKAEKGKTIIWPAGWTHTHKGQISNTKVKYIVTGWFTYDHKRAEYKRSKD
jgi:prolyl 4-hydroxylase